MVKKSIENERPVFPFTAIIGQEEMKLALILNVIDPKIGGVMIMGDRGTGKSTTIRAVADLLPAIQVAANDPFNSSTTDFELMSEEVKQAVENNKEIEYEYKKVPMVDLPLGATEDRVCGTIDIEKALTEGVKAFEPGLLAKANRGILYVDEVNLLDDHLVDILLACCEGKLNETKIEWLNKKSLCIVLCSNGYPENFKKNIEIENLNQILSDKDEFIFHAGTEKKNDKIYAVGGRVLNFVALSDDFKKAKEAIVNNIKKLNWSGGFYRRDIGHKVIK